LYPHLHSTFPISPPGCGRPPLLRVSLRLHLSKHLTISTCGSALDPAVGASPLVLPTTRGSRRYESHESKEENKASAFLGQKSPFATSPSTIFSHWARTSFRVVTSKRALSFYLQYSMNPCISNTDRIYVLALIGDNELSAVLVIADHLPRSAISNAKNSLAISLSLIPLNTEYLNRDPPVLIKRSWR